MPEHEKKPTPDPVVIDDIRFLPETLARKPMRDADIYAFLDGGPSIPLQIKILRDERERFAPRADGWGKDSPFRKNVPLPDGIGEWEYEHLTFPPEEFARFNTDITIQGDRVGWLSDFLKASFVMVRPKQRVLIEELDPGMNYFFPMKVFNRDTGDLVSGEYCYWVTRRRMWFRPKAVVPIDRRLRAVSSDGLGRMEVAWELKNNPILKNFVSNLPCWTLGSDNIFPAMSAVLFRRFKAESSTGLPEIETTKFLDRDFSQCIGHF